MAKVLVIDDSEAARNEVIKPLTANGIEVIGSETGLEALEILKKDSTFRLAIVDVNMPVLDGIGFVERVKQEIDNPSLSCLMLTTEFDKSLKDRAKAAGVKGWIIKPFDSAQAMPFIQKMLAD